MNIRLQEINPLLKSLNMLIVCMEESFVFKVPCRLQVYVNQEPDLTLEGQEEGEIAGGLMGVYERIEGKEVKGRGVWKLMGRAGEQRHRRF